ncbi:hypothetical protein BU17DRAFT_68059 [Hysterangium stoloniferum]|nr:hypothetical protein BU17DRAFT_68059 [Hysterangium stoloniferum]
MCGCDSQYTRVGKEKERKNRVHSLPSYSITTILRASTEGDGSESKLKRAATYDEDDFGTESESATTEGFGLALTDYHAPGPASNLAPPSWKRALPCPLFFRTVLAISSRYLTSCRRLHNIAMNFPEYAAATAFIDGVKSKEVCEEGDPTDGNPAIVTGVFIAACRHGIIWIISDMVKSGELVKYPLAACAYILELLPSDLGIGTTLANSSLGSNKVAHCTRHSTMYHRRQFIDMYFCQWDSNKYENLATFLLSNYQQALETIDEMTMCQTILTAEREIPHTQFMEWLNEEHVYLKSKASEPKEDISCIEYVKLLQKYDTARMLAEQARKIESDTKQPVQKMQLTCVAREAWEAVLILQREICTKWTAASEQYQAVLKYMDKQVFQLAVDKLEGLVVQHLFELTKANVLETGYKLRNQIAKAIKTRSKAI